MPHYPWRPFSPWCIHKNIRKTAFKSFHSCDATIPVVCFSYLDHQEDDPVTGLVMCSLCFPYRGANNISALCEEVRFLRDAGLWLLTEVVLRSHGQEQMGMWLGFWLVWSTASKCFNTRRSWCQGWLSCLCSVCVCEREREREIVGVHARDLTGGCLPQLVCDCCGVHICVYT